MRLPAEEQGRPLLELALQLAGSYYFLGRFPDTVELLEGNRSRMERSMIIDWRDSSSSSWRTRTAILGDYRQAISMLQACNLVRRARR